MQVCMMTRSTKVITKKDILLEDICQEHCVHPEQALAVRKKRLPSGKAADVAALFAVLSDPTRLQIVYALLHATAGELCVCDLAAGLGRDDTTISHQLRVLRHQKVVTTRKAGRFVYYRLTDEHIRSLLQVGITHVSEQDMQNALEVLHA
jgi:DNA-binding transcriptional ArsR family regulator